MKNIVKTFYVIFLTAVFLTACTFEFDTRPEAAPPVFVPVENITGIRTGSFTNIFIPLSGTVMPQNATYKKIEWSITNDGGTGSSLDGNRLTADNEGTVTVTARIRNGLGLNNDYTQDFEIEIVTTSTVSVEWISGIPATLTMGTYELNGTVKPKDAINTTILWSVKNSGTTGASIYGNKLTTTSSGTVVLTATIENGLIDKDYIQDITIAITKPVYASGYYSGGVNNLPDKACYWIDEERIDLNGVPDGKTSYTSGIVIAGNKIYIAGSYGGETVWNSNYGGYWEITSPPPNACYWVVDETTGPGGELHILDSISSLGGDEMETLSIAADGTTVYITGQRIEYYPTNFYLWKIEGNGTVTRKELQTDGNAVYPDYCQWRIAAVGGKVYIPFYGGEPGSGNPPYKSHYWDEGGNYHHLADSYAASNVAIINGSVYFAGYLHHRIYNPDYPNYEDYGKKLSYLIMGNEPVSFFIKDSYGNDDIWGNSVGDVGSIIALNGKIWFYRGGSGSSDYRFDTAGNVEYLPDNGYGYDVNVVTSSDGDVYISNGAGYVVFGKRICILIDDKFYGLPSDGNITGIVIRGSL